MVIYISGKSIDITSICGDVSTIQYRRKYRRFSQKLLDSPFIHSHGYLPQLAQYTDADQLGEKERHAFWHVHEHCSRTLTPTGNLFLEQWTKQTFATSAMLAVFCLPHCKGFCPIVRGVWTVEAPFVYSHVAALHNVLFGQFEFLATEQAETYFKICVLISHLTYICPSSFDCEELIQKNVFVNFKKMYPSVQHNVPQCLIRVSHWILPGV